MTLVSTMILGPLAAGMWLCWVKPEYFRKVLVVGGALGVGACALALARFSSYDITASVPLNPHAFNTLLLVLELSLSGYFIYTGVKARRPLMVALVLGQTGLMTWFEWRYGAELEAAHNLFVDKFSIVMALINGVLGGGICLYALGYMRDYHEKHHPEVADRRPLFFSLLFVFLGAMFGIIFSNNLLWLFFFWEITTLCSFLLIGYTQTEEARQNSLKALTMNLAGGLAFALGIIWAYLQTGSIEFQTVIGSKNSLVLLPAALFCFAGLTKSAQYPFAGWLLGAMVAPTPVSALLHSSTMVKAGVYLVLRVAPVMTGTSVGLVVALVGGLSFVIASFAAITASDAKKVLAYSTIANLGLIVLCGGIGTCEAVWAGLLLIVFHAVAKCLLFLCVGLVEVQLQSRNIEEMSGLILKMPRIAIMMLIGMAGMFLAPFGMLISKWAVLRAVVEAYPLLSIFIAFGSAATLFFWVKWMGKILEVTGPHQRLEPEGSAGEALALYGLSLATLVTCLAFPFISSQFIQPYIVGVYGHSATLGQGNSVLMMALMGLVMLFPLSFIRYGQGTKLTHAYLGGGNLQSSIRFQGAVGQTQEVSMNNYYLKDMCNELWLSRWGSYSGALLMVGLIVAGAA